jgi:hypothetical protein
MERSEAVDVLRPEAGVGKRVAGRLSSHGQRRPTRVSRVLGTSDAGHCDIHESPSDQARIRHSCRATFSRHCNPNPRLAANARGTLRVGVQSK